MKITFLAALLLLAPPLFLFAEESVPTPLLEITSGLPGTQVRLSWTSGEGVRYPIEKSTDLGGGGGGAGGWLKIALVEATGSAALWVDPEPTTTKAFYRIVQPEAEVFSLEPPVVSPLGGEILVHGQLLPPGSMLVLEIDGQPVSFPLEPVVGQPGVWRAIISGGAVAGGIAGGVVAGRIADAKGVTICPIPQTVEITANGFAADAPPWLPPAAPVPQETSNPIPGIGVVIKRNPGTTPPPDRVMVDPADDCDDLDDSSALIVAWLSKRGYDYYQAQSALQSTGAQTNPAFQDHGHQGEMAMTAKKGYDYYQAQSQLNSAALQNNPAFQDNRNQGVMARTLQNNPAFQDNRNQGEMPGGNARMAINEKGLPGPKKPKSTHRSGAAMTGVTGEVTLEFCPLSLACPAGPQLVCDLSYRSMVSSGSSSFGPGWTGAYDISVTPVPLAAGASAEQVQVRDGSGRCDIFVRQPDGSFTCNGMSRSGSFDGSTFTLTFADQGQWVFLPLDGSPRQGKIVSILDRNQVAVTCVHTPDGLLSSVRSAFGQSLTFTHGSSGEITRVTDHTDRYCEFSYSGGKLVSCTSPRVDGQPAVAGPATFTYSSGLPDPRLNDNLTSCRDGAGRLIGAFTYSAQTDPLAVDFDKVVSSRCSDSPAVPSATITYTAVGRNLLVCDSDELGRLTETLCDRQHRPVRIRQYTGFSVAGDPVTPSLNRPAGKLRTGDPDFYQTTCTYNAQHCPTAITHPDGLQERITYDWDLAKGQGLVLQRANPRICTLRTSGGEERTVSMEYLPGYGTPESPPHSAGIVAKENQLADPCRWTGTPCRQARTAGPATGPPDDHSGGYDEVPSANVLKNEEGGRHTPFHNKYRPSSRSGASSAAYAATGRMGAKAKAWMVNNFEVHPVSAGFITSLTTAHGQRFTNSYDPAGNLIACRTPVSGAGCDMTYNTFGQLTGVTTLNGPGSSFIDGLTYDATSHFCSGVVRDSAGLNLTASCTRDSLGRVISSVDPRGFNTLFAYNELDCCTSVQSPPVGTDAPSASRITTTLSYDGGGLLSRSDMEHRDATGALSATNPHYSSVFARNNGMFPLIVGRIAVENRPVNLPPGSTDLTSVGLANFDVCDFSFDAGGQCVEMRTPAACAAMPVDIVYSFQWDERGLVRRGISGGLGALTAVTTECDYTLSGDLARCATLGSSPAESPTVTCAYDDFRRRISRIDPMGNEETFAYDNSGFVTRSLFGELDDVPDQADNVLLARSTSRRACLFNLGLKGRSASDPPGYSDCGRSSRTFSAFFDVATKDDHLTVQRFNNSPSGVQLETTIRHHSPAGLLQSVTTNGDTLLTCTHDSAGRLVACADGTCSAALTLDPCGNVVACTRTDFSSAGGASKLFTGINDYDSLGRSTQSSESGSSCTFDYDSFSRLVRLVPPTGAPVFYDYDGGTPAQPYSARTQCDVDNNGTLETLGSAYGRVALHGSSCCPTCRTVADSNGSTTTFTCDSQGRLVQTDFADGTHESSTYDTLGNRTTHIRKSGQVIAADFNYRGSITSVTVSNADPEVVPVPPTSYHYDGRGNCVRLTQGTSDIVLDFDSCGDLVSESQNGRVVSHTHDHRGCSSTTYPDGTRFNEVRNAQGLLLSCAAEGAAGPPIVALTYLGSRVATDTRLNGVATTYLYRGNGDGPIPGGGQDFSFDACVQCTVTGPGDVVLSRDTFNRDRNQNIVRRETVFNGGPSTMAPLRRQVITRDRLGRLTRMQTFARAFDGASVASESDVIYTLDLEGKRLTATGGANPGAYTSSSSIPPGDLQMNQHSTWPGGNLEWDDNGNLEVYSHGTAGTFRYRYDALSRLVAVEDNATGTPLASYGYDAIGRLVSRAIPGGGGLPPVTTSFVYDGEMCIQELGGDGLPDMTFAALGHCISTRNGTIYYPHGGGSLATSPGGGMPHVKLVTLANGSRFECFDCDDAGKPIFLTSEGVVRQGASDSLSGLRWILRYSSAAGHRATANDLWCPESGLLLCPGAVYSPDLGTEVSTPVIHWQLEVRVLRIEMK